MFRRKNGFTFIEIMVTLIVLSVGLVAILKSFVISVDQMSHLTNRLYATTILDNHISFVERMLKVDNALPISLEPTEGISTGAKKIIFHPKIKISEIQDYVEIFQLEINLTWVEGQYQRHLTRSAYLENFREE